MNPYPSRRLVTVPYPIVPRADPSAFIAIMIVGAILSCLLAPSWLVVRSDGSRAGHNPKLNKHDESAGNKFVRVAKREALSVLALRHEKR